MVANTSYLNLTASMSSKLSAVCEHSAFTFTFDDKIKMKAVNAILNVECLFHTFPIGDECLANH